MSEKQQQAHDRRPVLPAGWGWSESGGYVTNTATGCAVTIDRDGDLEVELSGSDIKEQVAYVPAAVLQALLGNAS